VVRYLADKAGANIDALNEDGKTALHYAAWSGHLAVVEFLVDKGFFGFLLTKVFANFLIVF
jgi:ankyrin repeat protein